MAQRLRSVLVRGPYFGVGNETPMGKMCGINVGCLEGSSEEELSKLPIAYVDGMNERMGRDSRVLLALVDR
jgi:hypothetical protein